ncbi:fusaric acid resistance protein [Vibrio inusitatus NBRC 102082]|uniref:Fusaric acid resistance protein n=1 Tax=Vibrio inusitatus NBRC 102082 TaxID=1219070 RepID=A0A4Y3I194_9VIBR|nr:FUSC family protein [Vibrio inusitatus]GEA52978.1 fusaric acid resistance protein [Vibrio inusitatus NBRC 102082]
MFSRSTQDSIKVALALTISVVLALWFGWEKPYWAAITVIVAAANETYSHSIRKARNRLLGTIVGIGFAMILLMYFPQNHALFISLYTIFLCFCVYMASHKKYGYAFTMGATVCALIAAMGSFDGATTFHIAVLRIQETMLGLFVFGLVFSVLWPRKAEDSFFELLSPTADNLKQKLAEITWNQSVSDEKSNKSLRNNLSHLKAILELPLNGSHRLSYERNAWRVVIQAMELMEVLVESPKLSRSIQRDDIKIGEEILTHTISNPMNGRNQLQLWVERMECKYSVPKIKYSAFDLPLEGRIANVVRSLSILLTGFTVWWYVPIPGSYMMPMMVSVFANVLVTLPNQLFGQMVMGVLVWAAIFLAQYVLIMPSFTELWQLGAFYFINVFLIWRVTSQPSLALQRVLGVNFLMVMTMSALYLTPSYSLTVPITMLTVVGVCLAIGGFYIRLYRTL